MNEQSPLAYRAALTALAGCVATTARLILQRRIHLPAEQVGRRVRFADGTSARVFRETAVDRGTTRDPCALVVEFRLRAVRGRGHAAFRRESLLNTPLFAGFPGFVSKLWLADDERGRYRGLYDWDGPQRAEHYARALWRVLALVSVRGSIGYIVLPGCRREYGLDVHLADQRQVRESGVGQREVAERDGNDPGAELQAHRGRDVRPGQQRRRDPQRAQHLERAGVQQQRPGRPDRLRPPVDDPDGRTVVVGLQGQRQPGGTRAGHEDAGRIRHERTTGLHQAPGPWAAAPAGSCAAAPAGTRDGSSNSSRRQPGSTM